MSADPHDAESLWAEPPWPLSRLCHQESKLSDYKMLDFQERIGTYGRDPETVEAATRSLKPYPTRPMVELPRASRWRWGRRLARLLRSRRTRRGVFAPEAVTLRQWGTLLELSCGITGRAVHPEFPDVVQDLRAWPSGGALYPIEVYLAPLGGAGHPGPLRRAFYHYQVRDHRLAEVAACPDAAELARLVYADGLWENAGGLIVLTAIFARTQTKYGERGYRFVFLDAGHLAQNLLLVCEDLGLAAIPLGGFHDDPLAAAMRLDPVEESPVYLVLVGNTCK